MLPDFGWTELLVIAIVLIVVVGPKDLPRVIRGFSKSLGSMRKMAGDFRKQFDDALSEAELDDLKTLASDVKSMDPRSKIKEALNPLGEIGKDINDELKGVAKSIEDDFEDDTAPVSRKLTPQEAYPQLSDTPKKAAAKKPASKKSAAKKPAAKTATAKKPAVKATIAKTKTVAKKTTSSAVSSPAKMTSSPTANAKTATARSASAKTATAKKPQSTKTPAAKRTAAAKKPAIKKTSAAKKPAAPKAGDA